MRDTGVARRERVGQQGKILFQLDKMSKDLELKIDDLKEAGIIHGIRDKISQIQLDEPSISLQSLPKIIREESQLSDKQVDLLDSINESFRAVRRSNIYWGDSLRYIGSS